MSEVDWASIGFQVSDYSGNPATTCLVMLVTAIPTMFAYERLNVKWCPITARSGVPVHNACFTENVLLTLLTGILVNGPYALITTAVSAELGQVTAHHHLGK